MSRANVSEQGSHMENIDEMVARIESLAPIPPIATQILSLVEDQDACMSKIADLIRHDPSITANLLKICNSAYFGLVQKVESIYVAVTFEKINALVESSGDSFNEAEKKVIGISHEELGAMVAKHWSFSDRMIGIIRNHHLLRDSDSADLETQIVHLSDLMCLMMGVGTGADGLAYRFYGKVLDQVGVTDEVVEDIMLETAGIQKQIDELISLV